MKNWLPILALLAMAGGVLVQESSRGQVPAGSKSAIPLDVGPGAQGATLRQPALEPALSTPAPASDPVGHLWNPAAVPGGTPRGQPAYQRIAQPPSNRTDVNRDIEVTAELGPWLILVITYSGDNAPMQARSFVHELRTTYKLNAYVFNYGADEKRREYERAEAEREKQRKALRDAGLTTTLPIPVRVSRIDEQTGVLIGGYASREEAFKDLKGRIRGLKPPDTSKVQLHIMYMGQEDLDKNGNPQSKMQVKEAGSCAYVNPFGSAFPVRNPCVKHEETAVSTAEEVNYLRKINSSEPLSLFNCKKPYTLVIKQFKTVAMLQENPNQAKGFLDRIARGPTERMDYAAHNAHNLAEGFRKAGLKDTYVLHARYCSFVTVGGFESPEDPSLRAMQSTLEGRFQLDALRPLELIARPVPMEVPH